jgi:hypothetical protein
MHQNLWICNHAQPCSFHLGIIAEQWQRRPCSKLYEIHRTSTPGNTKTKSPEILKQYAVDWHSRKFNFWQPKPDWFLLNQLPAIEQKLNYIHLNPMRGKWSLVSDPTEYYYSSCRFYEKGINDFDFLEDYRDWKES